MRNSGLRKHAFRTGPHQAGQCLPSSVLRRSALVRPTDQLFQLVVIGLDDTYHYVQKEEFNGIEIGKVWSVWRAWSPFFPKEIGTWKIWRSN
ncbi:hypothetical protein MRS76_22460 [Rhizobiaceae bacterium n13]|uniref:Uncharacterized protein n=1 Tax=Ferirhizobium litorale TaxID=2927786 RepID=A0AAE3QDV8_9HYPH|nr:hypothetical protein [Fererhizobium litorale]MDI7864694.1 hypothetical protein [Fererhizobium litorale]MDI7922185.1 hypothetical protein [Fererhizobium litorale]